MWPASALITGNGVAFILRVPGHGARRLVEHARLVDLRLTAAVSLLSKYVIRSAARHLFNPSNFGLVVCFLVLGERRAEPLDFWWGPMDAWMVARARDHRRRRLRDPQAAAAAHVAVAFWVTFAAGIGLLDGDRPRDVGQLARRPGDGAYFWWVLVTSPEILVFLFFMITDPKTIPRVAARPDRLRRRRRLARHAPDRGGEDRVLGEGRGARLADDRLRRLAAAEALLAASSRLAAEGLARRPRGRARARRRAALVAAGIRARPEPIAAPLAYTGRLPADRRSSRRRTSRGCSTGRPRADRRRPRRRPRAPGSALSPRDPKQLARAATFDRLPELRSRCARPRGGTIEVAASRLDRMGVHLEAGHGQGPAIAVVTVDGTRQLATYMAVPPVLVRRDGRPLPGVDRAPARRRPLARRPRSSGPHAVP